MKWNKVADYGDMLIRVVVGIVFIVTGYGKLFGSPGLDGFSGMLTGIGFPIPMAFAALVGIIELVGGIMLLLGFYTRYAAPLLGIIMIVALLTVHLEQGWNGMRFPLLLLAALVRYTGTEGYGSINQWMDKNKRR